MLKWTAIRLCAWLLFAPSLACAAEANTARPAEKDKPNYVGAYLYTDRFEAAAKEQNRNVFDLFDEHFKRLADAGVNCIHVTIVDPALFDRYIALAKKHNIRILPELDFAYFRNHWSEEELLANVRKAADFLKVWHAAPEVIAWSVKEEPYTDEIAKLDRYYRLIIKEVPDAKFFLVTSGGGWLTANAADLPFALVGGDYYYFSWEQGLADKCFTRAPRFALSESRDTTALYRRAAAKFPVDRIHVFGVAACTIPDRAQGFATGATLPENWTAEQKSAYMEKVKALAEKGQDGWAVYKDVPGKSGPQYTMWTLYMPPANCIRALMWGSIMEGAKVTMAFSYSPYSKTYNPDSPLDAIINYSHRTERFSMDLGGRPGVPDDHFNEFAATVKKVRCYDRILPNLTIQDASPLKNEPGSDIFARAFKMEGFDGQVLIVHNANVGFILCPDCKSAGAKSCEHVFIDDQGDLKHFNPQQAPSTAVLTLAEIKPDTTIYDIATGKPLKRKAKDFVIDIGPGDAAMLYVGDRMSAAKLHQLYIPDTKGSEMKPGESDTNHLPTEFPIWPNGTPGAKGNTAADVPTLTPFLPQPGKATGAAVVICPGGGYAGLAPYEGEDYALFLAQHGVTSFVLKYRLGPLYQHPAMLQDAARAIRTVRATCANWKIDPNRLGVMGSSAGGHLASSVMTHFDAPESKPEKLDEVDSYSARPDFGILCYPVISMGKLTHEGSKQNLLGNNPSPELSDFMSSELQVTANTPPVFLWSGADDETVKVENSLLFASACVKHGVPVELHVYVHGRHGLGLGDKPPFANVLPWTADLLRWLRTWNKK